MKYSWPGITGSLLAFFVFGIIVSAATWVGPTEDPPNGNVSLSFYNPWTVVDDNVSYTKGNVGIGTPSPDYPVEIVNHSSASSLGVASFGSTQISNGIKGMAARGTSAAPEATHYLDRMNYLIGASFGGASWVNNVAVNLWAAEDQSEAARGSMITFDTTSLGATSRTERMRITAGGNVGIGTTNPYYPLTVTPGIASDNPMIAVYDDHVNVGGPYRYGIGMQMLPTWGMTFYAHNYATPSMVLTADGEVGIGTTNPAQKLSVAGVIESTTGGIKFPDGTTQTTAASAAGSVLSGTLCGSSGSYACNLESIPCQGYSPATSCPSGYTRKAVDTCVFKVYNDGWDINFSTIYSCVKS